MNPGTRVFPGTTVWSLIGLTCGTLVAASGLVLVSAGRPRIGVAMMIAIGIGLSIVRLAARTTNRRVAHGVAAGSARGAGLTRIPDRIAEPVSGAVFAADGEGGPSSGITGRTRSEDVMRKERDVISARSLTLETVGALAGGVAHEFNGIMTEIIGHGDLLLAGLAADDPRFGNATAIRRAADRAAALTRQLLAYGGKQLLQPETLDLGRVTADMGAQLRDLAGAEVAVRIATVADLSPVTADAQQIEQVILNIASNARDAMPDGGVLTLKTANVTIAPGGSAISHVPAGEYVTLAIADTGTGMSERVKARLFEPFFTTKGVGEGTGLALAACDGIIRQSGGHITVQSELGQGATFTIYLPRGQRAEVPVRRPFPPARGRETVLLVEHDLTLREMAADLLRRQGYIVLTAADQPGALSLVEQRGPDRIHLLITDLPTGDVAGRTLTERIHALQPETKTLFVSASGDGAAQLQKPFTPSGLSARVREALDR